MSFTEVGGPAPPPQRAKWLVPLSIALVVLLLAAIGAVITLSGNDDDTAEVAGTDASTTTTVVVDAVGDTVPGSTTDSTVATGDSGQTAGTTGPPATDQPGSAGPPTSAGDADLGAAQDPGPGAPPRAGSYSYRVTTGAGETRENTVRVEDAPAQPGRTMKKISGAQGGFDSDSLVAFEESQVLVTETTFRFNGQEGRCDWDPDMLQTKLPHRKSLTWSSKSSCTFTFGTTPVTVTAESSSTVIGLERRRIAGQVLDLWVVETTAKYEFAGNTIQGTSKDWVSPKHGLSVRTEARGGGSGPRGSGEGSYTSEILNLDPK